MTLGNETTDAETPVLTLYRDTNGWCPFCERVWVALRVKQISFRESLINLQDKPQWYKDLVPTTLVPAVLFHEIPLNEKEDNDNTRNKPKNERRIVWESMDILQALDDAFPETPQLVWRDSPAFQSAMETTNAVLMAGIQYQFASRNATLSANDKEKLRLAFVEKLDAVEEAMGASGGPFVMGSNFTAVDACLIPSMERWRYQLPITTNFDILVGRPDLQKWFAHLDQYPPYAHRVAGDEYSWTAVTSTFLRYFGGDTTRPDVAAAIARADQAAAQLTQSFASASSSSSSMNEFGKEAARKLISNHQAVVKDCTRSEPLSQTHIPRASDEETADLVLRHVASVLLWENNDGEDDLMAHAKSVPLVELDTDDKYREGALAARTVASRLCVPRDMSGPAAKALRAVLAITADRLENQS